MSAARLLRRHLDGGGDDDRSPVFGAPLRRQAAAGVWGASLPWRLLVTTGIGIWLLAAPAVLGTDGAAADSDRLVGAVVITIAVIATAEPAHVVRLLNIPRGLWLAAVPFVLAGATTASTAASILAGLAVVVLAVPRGPIHERYGTAQRWIR